MRRFKYAGMAKLADAAAFLTPLIESREEAAGIRPVRVQFPLPAPTIRVLLVVGRTVTNTGF